MRAVVLFSVLVLSACSVGDDYARPDTPHPATWRTDADTPEAAPTWPSATWWQRFETPSLDAVMAAAQQGNFDIAAAAARVRQADDQLRASGAALLPSINASAGGARSRSPFGASAGSSATRAFVGNSFNLGLSASYEIDFWGKNRALQEGAAAASLQSRFDMRSAQLAIQSSVAGTLFDLIGTKARLDVARGSLVGAEKILTALHRQRDSGLATALDETQQESQVESQRAAIPPLEQQIAQDRNTLALLLGGMDGASFDPPERLDQIALPAIMPGLPSELLERRPDVGSAEQQLVAANANITVARAQLFPDITLTGSTGFQSVDLENLARHTALAQSIGGSLAQIIFDGGRIESQVQYSRDRYDELLAGYRKAVLSAFLDVETALTTLRKSVEEEHTQRAYAEKALQANEISQRLLMNGMIDIVTLLNTQRTYYAAEDTLVQARLAHLQAVLGLYRALGGGWGDSVR